MNYFLCRITKLCKNHPKICENLIRHNVISYSLDLLMSSTNVKLQSTIINLLSILFQYRANRKEFKKFFSFFVQQDHLVFHFVEGLLTLVSGSTANIAPSFFLNFPQLSLSENRLQNDELDGWIRLMQELQNNFIPSPWTCSCLILSAFQNPSECIWLTGFSLSFWLKYIALEEHVLAKFANISSVERQMHVLSFGTDKMLLELWVDETKSCFSIKLTAIRGNNFEVYSKFVISTPIRSSRWHLIAFNVSSEIKNEIISVTIRIIIDGIHEEIFQTDFEKLPKKRANEKVRVLIGAYTDDTSEFQSSFNIGNLMMFQTAILDKAYCLTLCSYGPDFENFLALPSNSTKKNLKSYTFISHDTDDSIFVDLLHNYGNYIEHLRKQIILSFAARKSQHFYRYLFYGNSQVAKKNHPVDAQFVDCQQADQHFVYNIESMSLHTTPILPRQLRTFYDYILDNGGFSFVALLLAKVVELSECKIVHANILNFVLKICSSNSYLHSQLETHQGYEHISLVMDSTRFVFSEHSFIVLLEACCKEKLYRRDNICTLHFPRKVRIYNSHIIVSLILPHWRRWQECDSSLLTVFFKNLSMLIHPRNSHQLLNAQLLTSHGIVEKVLNFCREIFLIEEVGSDVTREVESGGDVNQELITSVLDFVQSIVSLSPSTDHFKQITDFLLVIQPSTALHYQPSQDIYFWSFKLPLKDKLKKRSQISHDEVNGIIDELLMKYQMNSDYCWSGEASCRSEDIDEADLAINSNFNVCTTCICENVDECTHQLGCVGNSSNNFCQECVVTLYDSALSQNLTPFCNSNINFLAAGLLNIVQNTLIVLSDATLKTVERDIINGDLLITLTNHPDTSVRGAVLKTVISYLIRSSHAENEFFDKQKGFHMLADQLALHPVTGELVNSCALMICRHSFISGVELPLCPFASPPLLAILHKSVPHFPLTVSILRIIKLIIKQTPRTLENLTENRLIDNLLKTIQIIIHTPICESCRDAFRKPLIAEIMDLFTVIVHTCLLNSTLSSLRLILLEVLYKWHWLTIIEDFVWQTDGEYLRIMYNLRIRILQTALDKVLSMIKFHCSNNKESLFAEDLMNRFEFVIDRNLEIILFPPFVVSQEKTFHLVCKLFVVLTDAASEMAVKADSVYQQVNVFLRKQTVYLLLWMLSPSKTTSMRMFPIRKLCFEPNLKKILVALFYNDEESEDKFATFLWQLTFSSTHKLSQSELFVCEKFIQRLRRLHALTTRVLEKTDQRWFLEVQTKIREMTIVLWERKKLYFDALAKYIKDYCNEMQTVLEIKRKNGLILSGNIIQRLGAQSHKYLCDGNVKNCIQVETKISWAKIIEQFTHERASWFVRLRPFNFSAYEFVARSSGAEQSSKYKRNEGKKFMIQKCLQQFEYTYGERLSYLFEESDTNASILSYILTKDVISNTFKVIKIQDGMEIDGEILISERNLYFIPVRDIRRADYCSDFNIQFDSIDEIFYRTYRSKDNCVEMFSSNGKSDFLYFFSQEKRDEFIGILKRYISSKRIICCCILDVFIHKWKIGLITNWEYLNVLNKLAGRSYNNVSQYPIMPSILTDYRSEVIDLNQPCIYRNLKKLSNVREVSKNINTVSRGLNIFSSSAFSPNTFSCSENNDSVISEYFDVSEILANIYTQRQNKAVIKNIKLPRWAHNNHRLFGLIYRQLLESHHIRKNLSYWIDLIFGCKEANNSVLSSNNSSVKINCQIKNPLFTSPHPIPHDRNPEDACFNIPFIPGVRGIHWGNYVGSPTKNRPSVVSKKYFSLPVVAFVPLLTNSVYVVFPKTAPLFFYNYTQVLETGQRELIEESHLSLLYWNSDNGIISIRENHVQKPIAFCPPRDPITVCATTPDHRSVWIGLSSGTIWVFRLFFNASFKFVDIDRNPTVLLGHFDKINGICLSRPFGIAISISEDKSGIVWDLNKMMYIRSINGIGFPLSNIAISDTLGDIATVDYDESNGGSLLRMHTIDGALVGIVRSTERITAVCFSSAPEGISVNVIATAFQSGVIRLWNTWDLSAVSEFPTTSSSPITSLTYSSDSQDLYAATENGYVIIWRSSDEKSKENKCYQQ